MNKVKSAIWGVLLVPLFFSCTPQKEHPRDWTYRLTPSHLGETPKSEYFILLGGTLAYGASDNDAKTMAHLMDQQSLHYKVYNRAHPRASAADILVALKNSYHLRGIYEESGVVAVVAARNEIDDYLALLNEMRKTIVNPRIRLAFLCEKKQIDVNSELPSPCIGVDFNEGVLTASTIEMLWQKF